MCWEDKLYFRVKIPEIDLRQFSKEAGEKEIALYLFQTLIYDFYFCIMYICTGTETDDMISQQAMLTTLRDLFMELLQTWQILDWPSTQASGLMMDGMFLCRTFFV